MTIPEIIKELDTYTGRFPMQAIQAAIEQREAIQADYSGLHSGQLAVHYKQALELV
jgi:hypothetical protein